MSHAWKNVRGNDPSPDQEEHKKYYYGMEKAMTYQQDQKLKVIDPCVYCGRSTAFGSGEGLFVNRLPIDDGWGCAECSGYECDECGQQIYLDCETRVDYEDENGNFHYGNYHEECYNETKHGKSEY